MLPRQARFAAEIVSSFAPGLSSAEIRINAIEYVCPVLPPPPPMPPRTWIHARREEAQVLFFADSVQEGGGRRGLRMTRM